MPLAERGPEVRLASLSFRLSKILAFTHRCGSYLKEVLKQIQSILFSLCRCPLPETWFKPPALLLLGAVSAILLKDDLFHQSISVENYGFIKNTIYIFIAYFLPIYNCFRIHICVESLCH